MNSKSECEYKKIFNIIRNEIMIQPELIICDYEKSLVNSLTLIFSNTKIIACIFHFSQIIWRKVKEMKLVQDYRKNNIIRNFIRKILTLPFYPIDQVKIQFKKILSIANDFLLYSPLSNFFIYLEKFYIGNDICDGSYPIKFWPCFYRVLNTQPRTTNAVESWHSSINRRTGIAHPNICRLLLSLQQEKESVRYKLIQSVKGINLNIFDSHECKELKLCMVIDNYEMFLDDGVFVALDVF
ncbi:hypothetical protein DMUE_1222 [Dictyocoela muelleri]|nr:hypothetical protein DMUE_1222 [Dictyocoela muelleri]